MTATKTATSTSTRKSKTANSTKATRVTKAAPAAVEAAPVVTKPTRRPTTCHELAVSGLPIATFGEKGCKRLPRHSGDHRSFLTVAAKNRAERKSTSRKAASKGRFSVAAVVRDIRGAVGHPRGRLNAAKRREALGLLFAMVNDGKVAASDALGVAGRLQ